MTGLPTQLREIVGPDGVLTEPGDLDCYRGDYACPGGGPILCVVRPRGTEEVSRVVRACRDGGAPIVPRGGGTGLAGGATPTTGVSSVLISFERLRAIRAIDTTDDAMVVEAGCPLAEAQRAAAARGRRLGLDHGGAGSSQIGGNLATNAGGNNVLRYGMARDQVLGLEVVLADGRVLSDLSRLRKNNAGYDLKQLFLGSEGTLGLITAASLRLRPVAAHRVTLCLGVATPQDALELLDRTRSTFGESVSAFEFMPRSGLDLHFRHIGTVREPFEPPCRWTALIEADSSSRHFDLVAAADELVEAALADGLVAAGTIAADEAQRAAFWRIREGIADAMIATPGSLKSDTAVPISAVPAFLEASARAVAALSPGAIPVPFGHLGDGNIHYNLLPPPGEDTGLFARLHSELARAIEDVSLALGGTISAEHGIGLLKQDALRRMRDPVHFAMSARLKAAFDPDGLLNPGKMFEA